MNKFFLLFIALIPLACVEEDPAFIDPLADFETDRDSYEVFQVMRVSNLGQGQFFSVFTGDPGHQYALRDSGDVGFKTDVNGNFSYSYSRAGTYTITYVASGYRLIDGERIEVIAEKQITVTDLDVEDIAIDAFEVGNSSTRNNKFLDPISFLFKDFRNTADTIDNSNRKVAVSYYRPGRLGEIANGSYNRFSVPSDINIVPRLKLSTASQTVRVEIDGVGVLESGQSLVTHETEDDLRFVPKPYTIINNEGQRLDYIVCPMIIPEFLSFALEGVNGTIELSAGDYNEFFVTIDLPDGTDLSALAPSWSIYDEAHTTVFVQGEVQENGQSPQNFSNQVDYVLEYEQPKGSADTYPGTFTNRSLWHIVVE